MYKKLLFSESSRSTYLFWLAGFLLGFLIALFLKNQTPIHNGAAFITPSFMGLFISSWFPVILVSLFCRSKKYILYTVLILNGFLFGFSSLYVAFMLQGSIPAFWNLFLMSQSCASLCLLFICATHNQMNKHCFRAVSAICVLGSGIICFIHYLILTKGLS